MSINAFESGREYPAEKIYDSAEELKRGLKGFILLIYTLSLLPIWWTLKLWLGT